MAAKNSLTISLAEFVVFLRGVDFSGSRRATHQQQQATPPALLRGLLTLELAKPTRITSIEIELQAKAATTLPDPGVGTRRPDTVEEQKVYTATQTFFRAVDPAVSASASSLASDVVPPPRRALSVDPGLHLYRDDSEDARVPDYGPPAMYAPEAHADRGRARERRRQSADFSIHHTEYTLHEHEHVLPPPPLGSGSLLRHDSDSSVQASALTRTPAYTPEATPPTSPVAFTPIAFTPVPGPSAHHDSASAFTLPPPLEYEARSASASRTPSRTPSRAPSRTRLAMMLPSPSPHGTLSPSHSHSRRESVVSLDDDPRPQPRSRATASPVAEHPRPQHVTPSPGREGSTDRGRRASRFSLAAVSSSFFDAVKERVRAGSQSVAAIERGRPSEKAVHEERDRGKTRDEQQPEADGVLAHLGLYHARTSHQPHPPHQPHAEDDHVDHKEFGHGWKEFKKGTYTFPVLFSIPPHMPPTLSCTFGSVTWKLKAHVHRPGVLTAKMSATRDVTVVATPSEDDTEDTENIVVERFWDDQLQYVFTVAGRMFSIGGVVPVDMTFLPLAKMKIIRLSILIEERIEYFVHNARVSRAEPATRITLLSLRHDKDEPVLPLSPHSLSTTPLRTLLPDGDEGDDAAAALMGPGPWTLSAEVRLPTSLHASNKNKRGSIIIAHALKIIMRVERGDDTLVDAKTGKRKQFEVVVHAPITLLSPLADAKYTSLPRYNESSRHTPARTVAFADERRAAPRSGGATPPTVDAAESTDTVLQDRYERYERLITGQESELGEAPPAYTPHQLSAVDEHAAY